MVKRILVAITGLFMMMASPALAQQAEGLWFGTLEVDAATSLAIVVEISRDGDGALTGTIDSPDQNAFGMPLTEVSGEDGKLAFVQAAIGARYEAGWNADKQAWTGTFFQGGFSWLLDLTAGRQEDRREPVLLPAEWEIPADTALGDLLARRIAGREGAGIVAAVLEPGENGPVTRIVSRGPYSDAGFDGDTVFEIGSMTKVFTALLLTDMALKGEVSLDDPVARYLPDGAVMPTRNGAEITLSQLSHQISGLPRLPDNMPYGDPDDPYADYTEALLLEFLGRYALTRDIGGQYEYSNLGVGLLGYVLARAAGEPDYESLVRHRILYPLGMQDTAITLTPGMQGRFATPHDIYMRPASPWAIPVIGGAGALRSTANDMLIFLAATLDPQSPIGPAMELAVAERYVPGEGAQYPLGWMLARAPSGDVLHHGGGTGGFRTHMAVQPARNRAVVVLTNAAIEPSASDIAMHMITGMPPAHETPVPPPPSPAPVREEVSLDPAQLAHVAGTYAMAPGMVMNVVLSDDGLTAQLSGQPAFPIFAMGPLEFFLKVVDARLVFSETDGVVTGATLFQNGREIPMERNQ